MEAPAIIITVARASNANWPDEEIFPREQGRGAPFLHILWWHYWWLVPMIKLLVRWRMILQPALAAPTITGSALSTPPWVGEQFQSARASPTPTAPTAAPPTALAAPPAPAANLLRSGENIFLFYASNFWPELALGHVAGMVNGPWTRAHKKEMMGDIGSKTSTLSIKTG